MRSKESTRGALVPGRSEREFPADDRAPAAARSFAKDAIGRLLDRSVPPSVCDDLELIVSELVTNAVRAGSATVHVAVEHLADTLAVHVRDQAAGWPEPRAAGIHDPGGRGLPLVSAISRRWGVRLAGGGKVVWAELPLAAS
jgi:anti-sigma regulatory factor (Ser/Thr protein kinase)